MQNNPAQKESRIVLVILGALLVCICLSLAGIVYIGASQGPTVIGEFQTQVRKADRGTSTDGTPSPLGTRAALPIIAPTAEGSDLPLLRYDDFTSNTDWSVGKFTNQYGTDSLFIQDGEYKVQMDAKSGFYLHDRAETADLADFYVAADLLRNGIRKNEYYGLIFRAQRDDRYYRFAITDEQALDIAAYVDGSYRRIFSESGLDMIRPGEFNRLAVSGKGNTFAFYINGQFVATITDDQFKTGKVGYWVAAAQPGESVTYSIDNFEIRAPHSKEQLASFATATAWQPTLAALSNAPYILNDTFDSNSNGRWETGFYSTSRLKTMRTISGGEYRWQNEGLDGVSYALAPQMQSIRDFWMRAKVKQDESSSGATVGVAFRYQSHNDYYKLEIRRDNKFKVVGRIKSRWVDFIDWTYSNTIIPQNWNTLQVVAQGNRFDFWINDKYVGSMTDDKLPNGRVGFAIEMEKGDNVLFEFDDLVVRSPNSQPTPKPSPTPLAPFTAWKILLDENFSLHSDTWQEKIEDSATRRFVRNIKSGAYTWIATNTKSADEFLSIPKMDTVTDFAATTNIFGSPRAQVGMIYRYSDDLNYYRFLAGHDGQFRIEARVNGEWKQLLQGYANGLGNDKHPHKLGVIAQGDNFLFFINDVQIAQLRDKQHMQGKIGLALATKAGETIDLSFDNFQVRVPQE